MELTKPSIEYKDSFIEAVREYQATDSDDRRDIYGLNVDELARDFPSYIAKLSSESKGEDLPEGYVPQTTYWLVDNGEFIGRLSIRHTLTEHLKKVGGHIGYDVRPSKRNMGYGKKLLKLGLLKAKELGIEDVLITCSVGNIGSQKVIEANGGVLEKDAQSHQGNSERLRYWISL